VTAAGAGGVEGIVNALAGTWPRRVPLRRGFADVVEDHLDDVYRYLLLLTADPTLAEDLTGETFEKALRSWRRYDPTRGSERAWLCRIGRSVALDHFRAEARRRKREQRYVEAVGREAEVQPLGSFSAELDAALHSLSAAEREVIALRIVLDLDADGAAGVLGISRTACSMRLARALRKLEERMESHAVA
jgi:RNA polymerase sigma factor (sigma-70 family)